MIDGQPRPYTRAFHDEAHYFEQIAKDIETLKQPDEPETVWWHKHEWDTYSKLNRNIELNGTEINAVFEHILTTFDIDADFNEYIRLIALGGYDSHQKVIQIDRENRLPKINSIVELLEYLGDMKSSSSDYPNDFSVSAAIESPNCLVVFQYQLEECGIICGDCSSSDVEPGQSCDHMSDQNCYTAHYQVVTVPSGYQIGAENHHWLI